MLDFIQVDGAFMDFFQTVMGHRLFVEVADGKNGALYEANFGVFRLEYSPCGYVMLEMWEGVGPLIEGWRFTPDPVDAIHINHFLPTQKRGASGSGREKWQVGGLEGEYGLYQLVDTTVCVNDLGVVEGISKRLGV